MSPTALILVLDAAILASIGAQPDLPDDFGRRGDIGASLTAPSQMGGDQSALEPQQESDANDSHPSTRIVADPAVVRPYWQTGELYAQYYGAEWCGPCRQTKPRVKTACLEAGVRLNLYDTDAKPDAAKIAGVSSIPVFVLCRNGKQVSRLNGEQSADSIRNAIRLQQGKTTTPVVSQSRNTNQVVSHNDFVSMHNRLHGGGQWTWPGMTQQSLREHLQSTHGVDLNGNVSNPQAAAVTSQRFTIRSLPRRISFVGRANYLSGNACPTCPR